MKSLFFLLLFCGLAGCIPPEQDLALSPLFSDHMVLQRETSVAFWGTATPGSMVTVMGSWGRLAKVEAAADGQWHVALDTEEAGGPYEVEIFAGIRTVKYVDVMLGEVWLASGQSNMEMPLAGWPPNDPILNSAEEIENADYPGIRMFTVTKNISEVPLETMEGNWAMASPETAGSFSATAYFFARRIHTELGVPVGIIHTSWGGTPAEAWTSASHLSELEDFDEALESMASNKAEREALNTWLNERKQITVPDAPDETRWANLDFDDAALASRAHVHTAWPQMDLPMQWENAELGQFDGAVWYRRTIDIPEAWTGQSLTLELGPIDDMDQAYFAGQRVGATEVQGMWQAPRIYAVPDSIVEAGPQTIALRVVDTGGGGGLGGQLDQMRLYPASEPDRALALAGAWSYLPVAEFAQDRFFVFGPTPEHFASRPQLKMPFNQHTPTVLYNAMIVPVVPYTIKGAIWYQGESNVGRAEQYRRLFPKMIESWRAVWDLGDFPFYFVQIAPYRYADPARPESAELREAQRLSQATPNTGMVVTLDVGNVDNIHPGNKQAVGQRLAGWALVQTYGQSGLMHTGPQVDALTVEGRRATVQFRRIGKGLMAKTEPLTGFEIAGSDGQFVPGEAVIEGDAVVVTSSQVRHPAAVRYAWTNGAEATLFNADGLPASSFSITKE